MCFANSVSPVLNLLAYRFCLMLQARLSDYLDASPDCVVWASEVIYDFVANKRFKIPWPLERRVGLAQGLLNLKTRSAPLRPMCRCGERKGWRVDCACCRGVTSSGCLGLGPERPQKHKDPTLRSGSQAPTQEGFPKLRFWAAMGASFWDSPPQAP